MQNDFYLWFCNREKSEVIPPECLLTRKVAQAKEADASFRIDLMQQSFTIVYLSNRKARRHPRVPKTTILTIRRKVKRGMAQFGINYQKHVLNHNQAETISKSNNLSDDL